MVFGSDGRAKRLVGVTGGAAVRGSLIRRRGNRHCRQTYLPRAMLSTPDGPTVGFVLDLTSNERSVREARDRDQQVLQEEQRPDAHVEAREAARSRGSACLAQCQSSAAAATWPPTRTTGCA